jgi:hypothetical protein
MHGEAFFFFFKQSLCFCIRKRRERKRKKRALEAFWKSNGSPGWFGVGTARVVGAGVKTGHGVTHKALSWTHRPFEDGSWSDGMNKTLQA